MATPTSERLPDDSWAEWTYNEYAEHVASAAAHLRSLGLGPGDRVVLMMRNSASFHMIDLAAMFCGATAISIGFTTPVTRALAAREALDT